MKTLVRNIIMLAVVVAAFGATSATAQTLRDANYNIVGKINPNGTVRNSDYGAVGFFNNDGTNSDYGAVGFFNNDGTIVNAKNKTVGRIDGKMQIFDNHGTRLGFINADGTVCDGEDNKLGTIDVKSGKVTKADGTVLGYANGISIQRVAAYYFFDFFKITK